ncbi:brefeldin A-inhibited guanine nucleotide-exchange protein 1-like [Rhincodon typus]|uniref:brefeldin A-inhibited guanine nucleotide-exchange protein 1-like n=1 Tax=Rhincodon typus TaxID=259920 RepID=UPI00202FA635|nr:brefeldin A-inhibited guanine nucleotide-exchange protein 1-like [Rhincodon typus]
MEKERLRQQHHLQQPSVNQYEPESPQLGRLEERPIPEVAQVPQLESGHIDEVDKHTQEDTEPENGIDICGTENEQTEVDQATAAKSFSKGIAGRSDGEGLEFEDNVHEIVQNILQELVTTVVGGPLPTTHLGGWGDVGCGPPHYHPQCCCDWPVKSAIEGEKPGGNGSPESATGPLEDETVAVNDADNVHSNGIPGTPISVSYTPSLTDDRLSVSSSDTQVMSNKRD